LQRAGEDNAEQLTLFREMDKGAPCVVSCSFGKDSLASAIVALETGMNVQKIMFCHVMFDEGISAEMPEQERFIFNTAIPYFRNRYGVETEIIHPAMTVVEHFYKVRQDGKNAGQIYGWPTLRGCWVNSNIKLRAIKKWKRSNPGLLEVVGIAADEEERVVRKTVAGKVLVLNEQGYTERDAAEICARRGLLPPIYSVDRPRTGCWFCQMQRTSQLAELRHKHPELWARMLEMDKDSPFPFKYRGTVQEYERRLAEADDDAAFWARVRAINDESGCE